MAYLLFPGRHLLTTAFQESYLWDILRLPLETLPLFGAVHIPADERIEEIVFSITSANRDNSRYNPISFHIRAIGIDRFARAYAEALGIRYRIIGIPEYHNTDRFAEYLIKEVGDATNGTIKLTPQNSVVLSSTPAMIAMWQKLGFPLLPAEYDPLQQKVTKETPVRLLEQIAETGAMWRATPLHEKLSVAAQGVWHDFPDVQEKFFRIWRDPLLTESGSLTETRNYSTYAVGMSHAALLEVKYHDIKAALMPGRIVDEGCADGALLARISRDFPDSDLIGIEVTSEFIARFQERQRAGEFSGSYVHVHQRNLTEHIFEAASIDTTICNSTTHELWSYAEQEKTVQSYLTMKFAQTKPGGRLVIRDVVGPEEKEQEVWLWLNRDDGAKENINAQFATPDELATHLRGLSTYARFVRFAEDFLADMRAKGKRSAETKLTYRETERNGEKYIVLSLKSAAEFLSKKDYVDNWQSELNEEFTFWSVSEWKDALRAAGFIIIENPNTPEVSSRAYTNPWIVEHRYEGKAKLFREVNSSPEAIDYPPTNVVLIAEKPLRNKIG